jgi:hypothetical protein
MTPLSPGMPVIHQRDGEVLARPTASTTLFFRHEDLEPGQLHAALNACLDIVGPMATWFRNDLMEANEPASPGALDEQMDLALREMRNGCNFYLFVDSGSTLDAVGPWALRYGHRAEYADEALGWLQLHMPPECLVEHADEFRAHVERLVATLPFWHGTAGFGVNYDYGETDSERNTAIRGALERYAGLDGHDLITESRALLARLKGTQWLTWLHRDLLARHPEVSHALKALADQQDARISTRGHGVLVQAGPAPLLGDRHRGETVDSYRQLNAALAPLLVDNLFPLPGFPDEAATRDWLHRVR